MSSTSDTKRAAASHASGDGKKRRIGSGAGASSNIIEDPFLDSYGKLKHIVAQHYEKNPPSRMDIHNWLAERITALSNVESLSPEQSLKLAKLRERDNDLNDDFTKSTTLVLDVISKSTDDNKIKTAKSHLANLLSEQRSGGLRKYLLWRKDNAPNGQQKAEAGDFLKRVEASTWKAPKTAEELRVDLHNLQILKAQRLLQLCEILNTGSDTIAADWEERDRLRTLWTAESGKLERQIKQLHKKGISEEDQGTFKKDIESCVTFTPQEKRLIDACNTLKQKPHALYRDARKVLLEQTPPGETIALITAIDLVRAECESAISFGGGDDAGIVDITAFI